MEYVQLTVFFCGIRPGDSFFVEYVQLTVVFFGGIRPGDNFFVEYVQLTVASF